ncbi:MAG: hypothetical protein V9H69_15955 [Anaerolineae bacterium]
MTTIQTGSAGRLALKAQRSPRGRCVAAEDVEVELHRVVDDAAQLADRQIDSQ